MERSGYANSFDFTPSGQLVECRDITLDLRRLRNYSSDVDVFAALHPDDPTGIAGRLSESARRLQRDFRSFPDLSIDDTIWAAGEGLVAVDTEDGVDNFDTLDANNYLAGKLAGLTICRLPNYTEFLECLSGERLSIDLHYSYSVALLVSQPYQIVLTDYATDFYPFYDDELIQIPIDHDGIRFASATLME